MYFNLLISCLKLRHLQIFLLLKTFPWLQEGQGTLHKSAAGLLAEGT
jgi:hypothetical protein